MLPVLVLIPVATSATLGAIYLLFRTRRDLFGLPVALVFLVAVYLQFMTRHALAGLLLQTTLAVCLAVWHKASRR